MAQSLVSSRRQCRLRPPDPCSPPSSFCRKASTASPGFPHRRPDRHRDPDPRGNLVQKSPPPDRQARGPARHSTLSRRKVALAMTVLIALIFSKYIYLASFTSYYTFYLISKFHVSVQSAQIHLFLIPGRRRRRNLRRRPHRRPHRPQVRHLVLDPRSPAFHPRAALRESFLDRDPDRRSSAWSWPQPSPRFSSTPRNWSPAASGAISGLFFGLAFGVAGIGAAFWAVWPTPPASPSSTSSAPSCPPSAC